MSGFRQGQNVSYIHPETGETRMGKYRGTNNDGTVTIQGGRFSETYKVDPTTVSKPSAEATRQRRNLTARINRSAITDLSVMKG
jgi:hypothetical protein